MIDIVCCNTVSTGLAGEGIAHVNAVRLCTMLVTEITGHAGYYRHFLNDRDVMDDIDRYVAFK